MRIPSLRNCEPNCGVDWERVRPASPVQKADNARTNIAVTAAPRTIVIALSRSIGGSSANCSDAAFGFSSSDAFKVSTQTNHSRPLQFIFDLRIPCEGYEPAVPFDVHHDGLFDLPACALHSIRSCQAGSSC